MPYTHHSHSGQFCNHATGSLAEILSYMIETKQMTTIALTEHTGRPTEHLYPDELADGWTPERLHRLFEDYLAEAWRLRDQYAVSHSNVQILVGFEGEWIDEDPSTAQRRLQAVLDSAAFDFWVGSVHHTHGHPVDYDAKAFELALSKSSGDEDKLFCAYFDSQYELLSRMKPPVVGHFDLIRLKCKEPDRNLQERSGVWKRVVRNLQIVKDYGGALEVNSSGLRKGLAHPYPRGEVLTEWTNMGGLVVLSDDSHGISHVGACYDKVLQLLRDLHIHEVGVMQKKSNGSAGCTLARTPLEIVARHPFWSRHSE